MRAPALIVLALLAGSAPARADQLLPQGRILDAGPNSGDIIFGSLKLGKRLSGKTTLTPDAVQIQGSGSTGEASGFCAAPAWSALCRSLASRAAETVNVLDAPGVDRTGAADSAAGVRSALGAITVSGNAAYVPSGSYRLDTNATIAANATIEFGATKFSGPGLIENSGDWTQYRSRRSHGWLHTTNTPGNEFAVVSMMSIGPTGSTSNNEKAAGSFFSQTSDPSKYTALGDSSDVTSDAVGVRGVGVVNPGNLRGRAYGGEFYGFISAGSKGASAGAEVGIDNRSGDAQPLNGQWNTSNVLSVFSKGNTPVANGLFVGEGGLGTGMYSAITVQQQAALNWAFSILKKDTTGTVLAGWKPDGSLMAPALQLQGAGSTGDGSGFCVQTVGGTTCRPLADRAAETTNVLDRGADRTGAADSNSAFVAASSAGPSVVTIPPGAYKLSANFEPPPNVLLDALGATFTPGTLGTIGDLTASPTRTFYKVSNSAGTDNAVNIAFVTRGSPAGANYQKSGLFVRATTQDGGSCTGDPLAGCKDIVAITGTGNVAPNVLNGRAYGANFTSTLDAGSVGVAAGYEVDVYNKTGVDHTADFYTGAGGGGKSSITGSHVVCGGNAPCDSAYSISSLNPGQAKFAAGLRVIRSAVRDFVLEINDDTTGDLRNRPAWIKPDGSTQFTNLTTTGPAVFNNGFFGTAGTIVGTNSLLLSSAGSGGAASVKSSAGPLQIAANGSSDTVVGSSTSAVVVQGSLFTGGGAAIGGSISITGDAQIAGRVGFNGTAPVGKCTLPAALPTDGTASNAAIATAVNAARACLITVGLAQ